MVSNNERKTHLSREYVKCFLTTEVEIWLLMTFWICCLYSVSKHLEMLNFSMHLKFMVSFETYTQKTDHFLGADYDDDGIISVNDLQQTVIALTRNELTHEEVAIICEKVLEEADNDDDRRISFMEFQHVISRAPEFLRYSSAALHSPLLSTYVIPQKWSLFWNITRIQIDLKGMQWPW